MTAASPDDPFDVTPDGAWAFARYEAARARLPAADFDGVETRHAPDLAAIAERYDAFVLDGFGVLNVGLTPVPGAPERMVELAARGKRLVVLTNGATQPLARAAAKYEAMGFRFAPEDIVASRAVAAATLERVVPGALWGVAQADGVGLDGIDARTAVLGDDPAPYTDADAFLLLSSAGWTPTRHAMLANALTARPRPVVCANPDVTAPFVEGFSLEPGHFAHDLADRGLAEPVHCGKPFSLAYEMAMARLPGIDPARVAMVGDTLHTDVLGGRAAGMGTVLVAGHGLFRGHDPMAFVEASGIRPDWIVETT